MALPVFTVTGNISQIHGGTTLGILDDTYPTTTHRVAFRSNLTAPDDLIKFDGVLYQVETVYAAIGSDGDLEHATMVANVITGTGDPVSLIAGGGIGVADFAWQFSLEELVGARWRTVTSWWFDAAINGATVDLSDVAPNPPATRYRGPPANIVSGEFDANDDLVLTNVDGSYTTPIELPASGVIAFVDNGDGTVQVG